MICFEIQSGIIEDEESLQGHKQDVQATNSCSEWGVTQRVWFLFDHGDQLQSNEGDIAHGKNDGPYPEYCTGMALSKMRLQGYEVTILVMSKP